MCSKWQAPPLPDGPAELFIGILSSGNHFAERKSWMQHGLIKSSKVVARFFVALHARKEVNVVLKKEAEFFGDIVIVPYMDHYDLVAVKTVAICEYGVRTAAAKYIMKCDDDARKVPKGSSFFMLETLTITVSLCANGKWGVTYEEEEYPPYANGRGYILSSDIGHYIVSEFEKHIIKLFKMEDVSMGMWGGEIQHHQTSRIREQLEALKFCQSGCTEDRCYS